MPNESKFLDQMKKSMYVTGGVFILIFLIGAIITISKKPQIEDTVETQSAPVVEVTRIEKEAAEKELTELMNLSKEAKLVVSYEFSNQKKVIYVSNIWYSQTVSFKQDFLAQVATLKETATGYRHFEVRNAYSNEKVAEVTAFSGSLEVYK